jgi:phosphoribosylformylglycinamidine synthase
MVLFFQKSTADSLIALSCSEALSPADIEKLEWLFSGAKLLSQTCIEGCFVGPRREMLSPWSTSAVEITRNMGITGIDRMEQYIAAEAPARCDPMLQQIYTNLTQDLFLIDRQASPIIEIESIAEYNSREGLALSPQEVEYLEQLSSKLGRKLTDSEVFGFSQVNSEHCRHKIFNGVFVIDGETKEDSLFKLIKKTSLENPNQLISAYKDNVAFVKGPVIEQFAPALAHLPSIFETRPITTVLSLKAETHNFPTTVEPFNGASTGTGGEIRDRLAGGCGSLPLAGTAVYMTAYPRTQAGRRWEEYLKARPWLYQTPEEILIKASNGASDFGNKYGQPLICGSLLTLEYKLNSQVFAYDKVIMLAGGVGYANRRDAMKQKSKAGQKVVVMGGDNYRIGMGGGAVSSVDTGQYASAIELNAVQRANPEMQKRVANVLRALTESENNPIVSVHDHGAGGHLNCLSELVESTGGYIDIDRLPVGDPTLSAKEIIGNESQERMGLLVDSEACPRLEEIAARERAPIYIAGETTDDHKLVFRQANGDKPIDLQLADFFGNTPQTLIEDRTVVARYTDPEYSLDRLEDYLEDVLQLEAVACKDWLTNKVDRSVTGKVARQQCQGELQLPLSDFGAVALDYRGKAGIATSIGHAPQAALVDPEAGSILSIAEALTNIVFAPLKDGLKSVSLSANWMWPCHNPGEDAALYHAVEACSRFACQLGINIPTGKDSLSMTQKYGSQKVKAPGTVIISAAAEVSNIRKAVPTNLAYIKGTYLYYIDFSFDSFHLGGSALFQTMGKAGAETPTITDAEYFKNAFNAIQTLIERDLILAGHDISAGGMLITLLEMCFANPQGGLEARFDKLHHHDLVKILFAENPGVIIQVKHQHIVEQILDRCEVGYALVARPVEERKLTIKKGDYSKTLDIDRLRQIWYRSSFLLDTRQTAGNCAQQRFQNYGTQPLKYSISPAFKGTFASLGISPDRTGCSNIRAAIVREEGTNGEREMAYALYLAGFDVVDVHVTDLASGAETLEDINMLVFCGGFSNSDVLGSAKGWAGSLKYNDRARTALENYYSRPDTLSLGVCNGCQLMVELNLLYPQHDTPPAMAHNLSGKFESAFLNIQIPDNHSVMFSSLAGSSLGIWVAHGEGRFVLPKAESDYHIAARYLYDCYPGNPNGSQYSVAALCSLDGRHLAMMPHLERAFFPWQCPWYPYQRRKDDVTPWMQAFVNARRWVENNLNR